MAGPSKAGPSQVANTFVADLNFYACFLIASKPTKTTRPLCISHPHTKTAQYVQKHGGKTLSLKHGSLTTASTPQCNAQPKEHIT